MSTIILSNSLISSSVCRSSSYWELKPKIHVHFNVHVVVEGTTENKCKLYSIIKGTTKYKCKLHIVVQYHKGDFKEYM